MKPTARGHKKGGKALNSEGDLPIAIFIRDHVNTHAKLRELLLPDIILVECKNWSSPVGSAEVVSFDRKVEDRGLTVGVLVATNGITGNADDRTQAQSILASSLARNRRIVVITSAEIRNLNHTNQLVSLFQEKLCRLVVSGGFP